MEKAQLRSPIFGVLWVGKYDYPRGKWISGLYDRADDIPGWLGIAPEFEFVVVQEWVLDKVDNKVLDIDDKGRITIEPQDAQEK